MLKRGFTILENIIVCTVVAVLTVSIIYGYKTIYSNAKADQDAQVLNALYDNAVNSTSVSNSFKGIGFNDLKSGLPSSSLTEKNIITTNGKNITYKEQDGPWPHSNGDLLVLTLHNINKNKCAQIISQVNSNFFQVEVNGDVAKIADSYGYKFQGLCDRESNTIKAALAKKLNSKFIAQVDPESEIVEVLCRPDTFNGCKIKFCSNQAGHVNELEVDDDCNGEPYNHPNAVRANNDEVYFEYPKGEPESVAHRFCDNPERSNNNIRGKEYIYHCNYRNTPGRLASNLDFYISDKFIKDNDENGYRERSLRLMEKHKGMLKTFEECSVKEDGSCNLDLK